MQIEVESSARRAKYWLKYKSYSSIHSCPSRASEQMHRYLRFFRNIFRNKLANCLLSITDC